MLDLGRTFLQSVERSPRQVAIVDDGGGCHHNQAAAGGLRAHGQRTEQCQQAYE